MTPTTNTEEQSPATSVVLTTLTATILHRASRKPQQQPFLHLKPQPQNQIHLPIGEAPNPLPPLPFRRGLPPPPPPSQTLPEKSSGAREEAQQARDLLPQPQIGSRRVQQQQQETERPCSVQRWDHPAVPRLGVGISLFDQSPEQSSRIADSQLRTVSGKVYERLSLLPQPFDVKINYFAKNPKSMIFYLEAILSRAFFENFELRSFRVSENGSTRILNPSDRCESNYASFNVLMELTWDEVLSRGTKHFSEEFSRFCDRENECHAFFGASKSVWLVHLLANSLNPGLQIFRVERDDHFDPVYKEETGGDRYKSVVRAMVQPGFYVYGSVVKCKVFCKRCGSD
ncbi:unnamed protein product [Brassica rapa]|uniref:Uncharacterized protein n=1 Tax=Brassica campestris TaxID=3711 RepID=M4EHW7_BRACM|nr:unnamed protein product [Brassica rapa]